MKRRLLWPAFVARTSFTVNFSTSLGEGNTHRSRLLFLQSQVSFYPGSNMCQFAALPSDNPRIFGVKRSLPSSAVLNNVSLKHSVWVYFYNSPLPLSGLSNKYVTSRRMYRRLRNWVLFYFSGFCFRVYTLD